MTHLSIANVEFKYEGEIEDESGGPVTFVANLGVELLALGQEQAK